MSILAEIDSHEGAEHIEELRCYLARVSELIDEMRPFAQCEISEFVPEKREECKRVVETARLVQSIVGMVTEISESLFNSLSRAQNIELGKLMDRLVKRNEDTTVMIMQLTVAMDFCERQF